MSETLPHDRSPEPAPEVFITGAGLITPLGASLAETWDALLAGRSIRHHANALLPGDEPSPLPMVSRLAVRAASEAVLRANWSLAAGRLHQTALVVGTSKGPIEHWIAAPSSSNVSSDSPVHPRSRCGFGLHDVADAVAQQLRLTTGPRLTLSAACASGLHALIRGVLLIRAGEADRVLVVAAEASIHPLFLGSFTRLGVLPPEGFGCRPFDCDRAGFLMSEAAAAVCLEAAGTSHAVARVGRFAMGGDATHLTGVDPAGKTLRYLLKHVLNRREVDLVHGHGTGTPLNDPIEVAAIEDLLPGGDGDRAFLYSHKGAIGHSLGAAGLVSVVLSCEMARHGTVLPNVQTRNPLPTRRIILNQTPTSARIRRSIAIAAGFGGATAVVSIETPGRSDAR